MGNGRSVLGDYSDHPPIHCLTDVILAQIFSNLYGNVLHKSGLLCVMSFTNREKQRVLQRLRLVCNRWNRIVVEFMGVERFMNLDITFNLGNGRMMTRLKGTTTEIPFKTMIERHLQHLHPGISVAIDLDLEFHEQTPRVPVTSQHISQIIELMRYIPNIWAIIFAIYAEEIEIDQAEIQKLLESFTRPDYLRQVQFFQNDDEKFYDLFDQFLRKHDNLEIVGAEFGEGPYRRRCKKLLRTVMQKREDEGFDVYYDDTQPMNAFAHRRSNEA